jgi:YVTN family beta-propeller protein
MKFIFLFILIFTTNVFAKTNLIVDHRIKLTGSTGWDILSIDNSSRLFISRGDYVDVIDLKSEKLIGTISEKIDGAHAVAFAEKENKGYITSGKNSKVVVFDLKSLKVLKDIPAGKKADVIIYDNYASQLFAFNADDNTVTVIDPTNDSVVGTILLSSNPEFAVSDKKGKIYVNLEGKASIAVIDVKKLKVLKEWPLAGCEEPSGIAADFEHHTLLSTCHNEIAAITDIQTGKLIKNVVIGKNPDGAAFDNGLFYSSNGIGTLTVISNKNYDVLQSLETQKGARTMVINPKTHLVYTVTALYETLDSKSEKKHPQIIPDSVELLVIKNKKN